MKNNNIIFLNSLINCLFLNKNNKTIVYIYNKNYFIYLYNIKSSNFFFNKNINAFIVNFNSVVNLSLLTKFFNELTNFNYKKLIFNGKGFKLKKLKNKNLFNFNNSHIKLFVELKNKLIKNSKNSFIYIYKNNKNLKNINFFLNLFKINIFTKRGIKLNRTYLLVKKTKKK